MPPLKNITDPNFYYNLTKTSTDCNCFIPEIVYLIIWLHAQNKWILSNWNLHHICRWKYFWFNFKRCTIAISFLKFSKWFRKKKRGNAECFERTRPADCERVSEKRLKPRREREGPLQTLTFPQKSFLMFITENYDEKGAHILQKQVSSH